MTTEAIEALESARWSLKGARGLAVDSDAPELDAEFAQTIDRIGDALMRLTLPDPVDAAARLRDLGFPDYDYLP